MNFWKGHKDKTAKRKAESGNVLLVMFAAVAVVGVIGGSANVLMRGPLKTMSEVNEKTLTESRVMAASKMIMLDAENLSAGTGDCDGDRVIEPRAWRNGGAEPVPTGGGLIPHIIGSAKRDPWGAQLGYCAWDHGSLINGVTATGDECSDANRLEGTNDRNYPTVAVISAGPNGTFDTTCRNWAAADLDSSGDIDTGAGDELLFDPGGDDIFVVYSYAEAVEELPTIWREDTPNIWQIGVDTDGIEVVANDDVEFTGSDVFAPTRVEMIGDLGLLLPDETQLTDAECTAGTAEGEVRLNKSGATPVMEVCESNSFSELEGDGSGSGGGGGSGSGGGGSTGDVIGSNDGLVGYWRLDETSGSNIVDSAGNSNGTWNDTDDSEITTESSDGAVKTSLFFSGAGDLGYIDISTVTAFDNLAELSGCIWFNIDADSSGANEPLFGKSGSATFGNAGWSLQVNIAGGNTIHFETNMNDSITTTISDYKIYDGVWNHVCATWDGTDGTAGMAIYLNGVLADVTTSTAAGTIDDSGYSIEIGANDSSNTYLDGYADDVRLYNRALSAAEVKDIYGRTQYVTQANVTQSADIDDTIGSFGWSSLHASDSAGSSAGMAFKVDNNTATTDTAGAAITAHRTANPGRANLAFKTDDGSNLNTGMVVSEGALVMDNDPDLSPETNIQIGDHYGASWNSAYDTGLLIADDTVNNENLGFFGNRSADDASMQLLFSKMLKLQYSGGNASSVREYLRFESTPKVTAYGDILVADESSDAAIRVKQHSGTASNAPIVDFARKRSDSGAVQNGDAIGSILFQGNDGGFPSDSHASIKGVVNGAVATDDVPIDLVFGTNSAGSASSNEGLRITSDGNVGVGVAAPAAKFHADGRITADEGVKIGNDTNCTSASDAGTMRYDNGAVELCDGSSWVTLDGGGGSTVSSCDAIPFDFTNRDDLTASTVHETNRVRLGLIGSSCTLAVSSDGTIVINKNGVDQAGEVTSVATGDIIYLKITSSATNAEYISSYVTVGTHTDEVLFQTAGKIVFVTSSEFTGQLGGLDGAHKICQDLASAENLKGSFKAWLATDTPTPDNIFRKYTGNYILTDGTVIANGWSDLTDGSIDNTINIDETGTAVAGGNGVWSRVQTSGIPVAGDAQDCGNWTNESSGVNGRIGQRNQTNTNWTHATSVTCDDPNYLYCFEQ